MNTSDKVVLQQRKEIGKMAQELTDLRRTIVRICELIEDAAQAEEIPQSIHEKFAMIIKEME